MIGTLVSEVLRVGGILAFGAGVADWLMPGRGSRETSCGWAGVPRAVGSAGRRAGLLQQLPPCPPAFCVAGILSV